MNVEDIKVSIFVITYNQKDYISKTLDSLVKQKTSFKYEILVNDDCSTDGTQEIILKYKEEYPELVKPILQTENQYSKGINPNKAFNYPRAKGKYIAMCEGDDYWSDEKKLQLQYDALESNLECSICVHDTRMINVQGDYLSSKFPSVEIEEGIISAKNYMHYELVENPWLFQTSSFFMRKDFYDSFINDGKAFANLFPVGDKPLILYFLLKGNAYYVKREMSCYRTNSGGIITTLKRDNDKHLAYINRFIDGYRAFDQFSNYIYHTDVEYMICSSEMKSLFLMGKFAGIRSKKYEAVFHNSSFKYKVAVYLGCLFPNVTKRLLKLS